METFSSIIQVLQLNQTFFIYLIVFAIFLVLTDKLLLSPAFKRFLKQESLTTGQALQSQELQKENEELRQKYEQALVQYNQKIQDILNQKKLQLLTQQRQQIEQAQKEAQFLLAETRDSLNEEYERARKQLFDQVPELTQKFLSKVNM